MWGKYIEQEIHEAVRGAKNEKQANSKVLGVMRRIMNPPEDTEGDQAPTPAPTGKFRDPAAMTTKG